MDKIKFIDLKIEDNPLMCNEKIIKLIDELFFKDTRIARFSIEGVQRHSFCYKCRDTVPFFSQLSQFLTECKYFIRL